MCRPHLDSNSNKQQEVIFREVEYKIVIRWCQGIAANFVRCDNGMVITFKIPYQTANILKHKEAW